jgi:hypothetical protein
MEVLDKINLFYSILERGLQAANLKFDAACQTARLKVEADFKRAKQSVVSDARTSHFQLECDFSDANKKVESDLRTAGLYFSFTEVEKNKLKQIIVPSNFPDTLENYLHTSLSLLTKRLLSTEPPPSILEFLFDIKGKFASRWDALQRANVGVTEIFPLTITNYPWAMMTNGFVSLASNARTLDIIELKQFRECIPSYTQDNPGAEPSHYPEIYEILFPKLLQSFERSMRNFDAGKGFFWVPDTDDLQADGEPFPIRLYTPTEKVILENKYGMDLCGYAAYFVTEKDFEPSITENTFEMLWRLVQEALLIEYTVTLNTHPREIRALIAKNYEETLIDEYAEYMEANASLISRRILAGDPNKEKLIDYVQFKEAGLYGMELSQLDVVGNSKVVCSSINRQSEVVNDERRA